MIRYQTICRAAIVSALFTGAAAGGAPSALAQDAPNEAQVAKILFNSGAEAYASGQFAAAIQAFTEANRILPRPAIVYSLAQAHRRQYFLDRNKEHLEAAISGFRAYIEQVPDGGRRADAAQALSELEPMLARMGETAPGREAKTPREAAREARETKEEPARLMVTTQPSGAVFTIDGKDRRQAPYAAEIAPGKHRVHVSLDGYFDEEREVLAVDRTLVPIPIELRERPARLLVTGPNGCDVFVDGRPVGTTPQAEAIELASGSHLVVVTKNGYKAFSQDIDFRRNERKTVPVALEATGQRIVARTLLVSGGVLVLAGGVFSVLALNRQSAALDIPDAQKQGNVSPGDSQDYNDAKQARDRWRTGALLAFSVGGAALATGLMFYIFDRPTVLPPRARPEDRRTRPSNPLEPMEMSMVPLVAPSFGGAALTGKF